MFMWREFTNKGPVLIIRFKKTTWTIRLVDSTMISFSFDHKRTELSSNGSFIGNNFFMIQLFLTQFIDKHVYWPTERSKVQEMFTKLQSKSFNSSKLFKWLGKKSETYLRNISIHLTIHGNKDSVSPPRGTSLKRSGLKQSDQ